MLKVDAEANIEDDEDEEEDVEEDLELDYEKQVKRQQSTDVIIGEVEDDDDDDCDEEEEDLELYNLNRNSKKLAKQPKKETENLKTFVRVPLKKGLQTEQQETQRT